MRHPLVLLVCAALLCVGLVGVGVLTGTPEAVSSAPPADDSLQKVDPQNPAGLARYIRWSDKIAQGAQPSGIEAFRSLKALGFTTVITVDGAMPPVELAKAYGLRYVHVPIGYDGVPRDAALKVSAAVAASKGPVYIHCHHGKHRGPAAAMVARQQCDGVSPEAGRAGLVRSGTSKGYTGLWRDVETFERFTTQEMASIDAAALPAAVRPADMLEVMVDVSHRYELLKASKAAGWKTPEAHPDVSPPHEARMLWELYRESQRLDSTQAKGAAYVRMFAEAEAAAVALEKALRVQDADGIERAWERTTKSCKTCHEAYRN